MLKIYNIKLYKKTMEVQDIAKYRIAVYGAVEDLQVQLAEMQISLVTSVVTMTNMKYETSLNSDFIIIIV